MLVVVAEGGGDAVQVIANSDHRAEIHENDLKDGSLLRIFTAFKQLTSQCDNVTLQSHIPKFSSLSKTWC